LGTSYQSYHFTFVRETTQLLLGKEELAAVFDIEHAAAAPDQFR